MAMFEGGWNIEDDWWTLIVLAIIATIVIVSYVRCKEKFCKCLKCTEKVLEKAEEVNEATGGALYGGGQA